MENIKDYLHLYLGCKFIHNTQKGIFELSGFNLYSGFAQNSLVVETFPIGTIKLILRPLSDMTDDEAWQIWGKIPRNRDHGVTNPKCALTDRTFHFNWPLHNWSIAVKEMLALHFDVFNLIPEGLAIDKTTIKPEVSKEH
jgi:hypothetical protein